MTASMSPDLRDHGNGGEPDLGALAAFVDGRLSTSERASIVDHVADCQRCRTIVAELMRGQATSRRGWIRALPIAASLTVAAGGVGLYLIVHDRNPVQSSAPVVEPRPAAPAAVAPPVETPASSPAPDAPRPPASSDMTRDAGTTVMAGKTFRLVAGEWVDADYHPTDFLPVAPVRSRDELEALGELKPFASLGSRFTVVVNGTVYRVSVPPAR